MEKKKFKMGLVPKLILAIILGILFGQFLPEGFCRLVVTLSGFFSNFLKFVIPLMILAYVTMGIADLSQGAGKLLLITVALAYGSTLIAGSASFLVAESLFPSFMWRARWPVSLEAWQTARSLRCRQASDMGHPLEAYPHCYPC